MKVVLLAGGFGSRISEESQIKPKPMIEIGGMPILWHIMKEYAYYGHTEFIICAGYKQEYIKEWFANYLLQLIEFHRNHGKLATLTAVKIAQDKGVLDITKDQAVRAFREKNTADGTPINAGYMVLEPQVFDMLEGGDECIFEKTVLVKLAEQGELMSYVHTGFWQCMQNRNI